jgi:hypothetical protein
MTHHIFTGTKNKNKNKRKIYIKTHTYTKIGKKWTKTKS